MDFEFQVNMLGEYKNLTVESGISDLPMTINYNNDVTKKEFENIYDSSTGYLKRSLVAPKGKVDVHEGKFINLRVSNLIIEKSKVDGNEPELKDSHTDLKTGFLGILRFFLRLLCPISTGSHMIPRILFLGLILPTLLMSET